LDKKKGVTVFFQLSNEQLMIQSMVREFSRKEIAPTAMERDRTKAFPFENLRKMGELGLMGMTIPPEYNGEGADTVSYVLALSEIAYACASTAVVMSVHNSIVCESIFRYGNEEQRRKYLPVLTAAEKIGAFAMTEPHAGSDPVAWPVIRQALMEVAHAIRQGRQTGHRHPPQPQHSTPHRCALPLP